MYVDMPFILKYNVRVMLHKYQRILIHVTNETTFLSSLTSFAHRQWHHEELVLMLEYTITRAY